MGGSSPFPTTPAIARAELFTHERFVYEGEALEDALAPGGARRRALDAAVAEMDAGAAHRARLDGEAAHPPPVHNLLKYGLSSKPEGCGGSRF